MILRESNTAQTIRMTPRSNAVTSLAFTNETTQEVLTYNVTQVFLNSYWIEVSLILGLKENNSYTLKAFSGSKEVFYTKLFCTNQENYTINNDVYVKRETTNSFIIIE